MVVSCSRFGHFQSQQFFQQIFFFLKPLNCYLWFFIGHQPSNTLNLTPLALQVQFLISFAGRRCGCLLRPTVQRPKYWPWYPVLNISIWWFRFLALLYCHWLYLFRFLLQSLAFLHLTQPYHQLNLSILVRSRCHSHCSLNLHPDLRHSYHHDSNHSFHSRWWYKVQSQRAL